MYHITPKSNKEWYAFLHKSLQYVYCIKISFFNHEIIMQPWDSLYLFVCVWTRLKLILFQQIYELICWRTETWLYRPVLRCVEYISQSLDQVPPWLQNEVHIHIYLTEGWPYNCISKDSLQGGLRVCEGWVVVWGHSQLVFG